YLSPDLGPQLLLVGAEKVSIDSNNGVLIDTPFSLLIDTTNELSIDEPSRERYARLPLVSSNPSTSQTNQAENQASACALISLGMVLVSYSKTHALRTGLQPLDHLSSDMLHYANDPPGHAGFQLRPELELLSQKCFTAQ
ncbi:hypothetical protein IGI04_015747, partial [Brassica rapa subsp. trilocularis]